MYTSFLEIYNEKIRDLLSKSKDKVCDIHLDPTTREPVVPDLTVGMNISVVFALFSSVSVDLAQ
jgi:hypothetical protein